MCLIIKYTLKSTSCPLGYTIIKLQQDSVCLGSSGCCGDVGEVTLLNPALPGHLFILCACSRVTQGPRQPPSLCFKCVLYRTSNKFSSARIYQGKNRTVWSWGPKYRKHCEIRLLKD